MLCSCVLIDLLPFLRSRAESWSSSSGNHLPSYPSPERTRFFKFGFLIRVGQEARRFTVSLCYWLAIQSIKKPEMIPFQLDTPLPSLLPHFSRKTFINMLLFRENAPSNQPVYHNDYRHSCHNPESPSSTSDRFQVLASDGFLQISFIPVYPPFCGLRCLCCDNQSSKNLLLFSKIQIFQLFYVSDGIFLIVFYENFANLSIFSGSLILLIYICCWIQIVIIITLCFLHRYWTLVK